MESRWRLSATADCPDCGAADPPIIEWLDGGTERSAECAACGAGLPPDDLRPSPHWHPADYRPGSLCYSADGDACRAAHAAAAPAEALPW